MPAELPRKTAPNHPFATQAARTQRAAPSFFLGSARERNRATRSVGCRLGGAQNTEEILGVTSPF